jgi:hypothetical protein
MAVWLALAAMLTAGPAGATGKYVCMRGMAAAGPACPLCHGHRDSESARPVGQGPCCTYVFSATSPMTASAAFQLTRPLPQHHPCTPGNDLTRHIPLVTELLGADCDPRGTGPPSSPYPTTFLRL